MRRFIMLLAVCLTAGPASAEFVPGRLYISVNPLEGFPDQPNAAVFEFDPLTGQSHMFAEMPDALDGRLSGLCFSPDGSTLFASLYQSNTVAAIAPDGSVTAALTGADGLAGPLGANNLDFDLQGNFYVGNDWSRDILRFPAGGGSAELVTDDADHGPLTIAPSGQLYHAWEGNPTLWVPDGKGSSVAFDTLPGGINSLTSSSTGDLFVGLSRSIYKYANDDPSSRILLTSSMFGLGVETIALSPDESTLYVTDLQRIFSVSVADGATAEIGIIITDYPSYAGNGLAVYVPEPSSLAASLTLLFVVVSRIRR